MDWGGKIRKITKFIEHLFKIFFVGRNFFMFQKLFTLETQYRTLLNTGKKKKTANEESLEMNLDRF